MNRRSSAALALAAALAAGGNLARAQPPTVAGNPVRDGSPSMSGAASRRENPMPRLHTRNQMFALTTAEMIYMHELLVSNLVSVTPAAVPAPPVSRSRATTSPATEECS